MNNVFITRKIPPLAVEMLSQKGYEIDVSPHDRPLTKDELINFLKAKPYDAVLSLLTDRIDNDVFEAAPTVKIFANYAIGYDNFDVESAKKRGVYLSNTPHGGSDRVAEHAWALILALSCRIVEADQFMRTGKYTGWDPMLFHGIKIAGKTLGMIGAGRIGTEVARIGARGFGMRVAYYDKVRNEKIEELHSASFWPSVEEVIRQSDIISVHVPLTAETKHIINEERLNMMKPSALLINTSRGPVIDESALVKALRENKIAGAGLDVFENEPQLASGLAELKNVVLTPHIASASTEARDEMSAIAALNIIDTLSGGKPRDLVYN